MTVHSLASGELDRMLAIAEQLSGIWKSMRFSEQGPMSLTTRFRRPSSPKEEPNT